MSLDTLKTKLFRDPLVKKHYDEIKPEFNKACEIIKQNRLIKAKYFRILMYMYAINIK